MTVDGMGNLYEGTIDCSISKLVLATGERTTIAGTPGVCSRLDGAVGIGQFQGPAGMALDGLGSLYVADGARRGPGGTGAGDSTIRKVELATGIISTIAGSTVGSADGVGAAAHFFGPTALALDGSGSLYIADDSGHTIRKLVLATGEVTTEAGTAGVVAGITDGVGAAARFSEVSGLAVADAGLLYAVDFSSTTATIRKVVLGKGEVSTIAGSSCQTGSVDGVGPAARFDAPIAVTAYGDGSAYIVDFLNGTIRKIVPSTRETTIAGRFAEPDPCGGACSPRGYIDRDIVYDGAGYLYLSYGGTLELGTGVFSQVIRTSPIDAILATDRAGHLYSGGLGLTRSDGRFC